MQTSEVAKLRVPYRKILKCATVHLRSQNPFTHKEPDFKWVFCDERPPVVVLLARLMVVAPYKTSDDVPDLIIMWWNPLAWLLLVAIFLWIVAFLC